jgi:hypothetical protein
MPATHTFDAATTKTFLDTGWTVRGSLVVRREFTKRGAALLSVHADGTWLVSLGQHRLGGGKGTHPCLSACDANEVAWTYRDHHPLEPLTPPRSIPRGGCQLATEWSGGRLIKNHQDEETAMDWLARRKAWGCEITLVSVRTTQLVDA